LFQTNYSPWGKRLGTKPGTHESQWLPPVEGSVETLVQDLLSALPDPETMTDIEPLKTLAQAIKMLNGKSSAGVLASSGRRSRFRYGSPVKSNRFT
jgi:hypothetical protein